MTRLLTAARFVAAEFGPLIIFAAVASTVGVKAAIAASLVVIVGETLLRWRRGLGFTRLYLLVSGLTLVFGAIDLVAVSPFMLAYEAVFTNVATAAAFVVGALGDKPMIQEVAEQRANKAFPDTPAVRRFFQYFTLVWAAYFLVKAALYAWLAWRLPLVQAMALRSLIGGASLAVMIAVSVTQGPRLFALCRRFGLLPGDELARAAAPPQLDGAAAE